MVKGGDNLRDFIIGGLGLVAGGALVLVAGLIGSLDAWDDGKTGAEWIVALVFGLVVMIGAPATFWIILPVWRRVHKPGPQPGNQNEGR